MLDWLAQRAQISSDKVALIAQGQEWTYGQLNQRVSDLAARLAATGVQPGQRVAALMPNRAETVALIHAIARVGAVLVPLNIRLTEAELRWQADRSGCVFVIASRETEAQAAPLAGKRRRVLSVDPPGVSQVGSLMAYDGSAAPQWEGRPLDWSATQGIIFTSGTTGQPKGALLTFANHLWSAMASAYRLGVLPGDRWLLCMPLYHVGGQAIILRSCLYGTTVVLQDGFDVSAVSHSLAAEGITLVSLVPTMLHRLLEHQGERPLPARLRCILLGGAAPPTALLDRCRALRLPVSVTYGLTEAASQVATASPDDLYQKPGSVGKPLLFTEVRIVGDDGREVPRGEVGEIAVSGPTVMSGYEADPQATAEVLRDGWLHTGDLGFLDEDSDLWVVQRRTDLIVSGGENVYPAEVEAVLLSHPSVQEACVVGIPDGEWGQRVAALVVLRQPGLTADELMTFCREKLAGYKLPRVFRFADSLPQTASGKVSRQLAQELIAGREPAGVKQL